MRCYQLDRCDLESGSRHVLGFNPGCLHTLTSLGKFGLLSRRIVLQGLALPHRILELLLDFIDSGLEPCRPAMAVRGHPAVLSRAFPSLSCAAPWLDRRYLLAGPALLSPRTPPPGFALRLPSCARSRPLLPPPPSPLPGRRRWPRSSQRSGSPLSVAHAPVTGSACTRFGLWAYGKRAPPQNVYIKKNFKKR